jgi:hypothetical protein
MLPAMILAVLMPMPNESLAQTLRRELRVQPRQGAPHLECREDRAVGVVRLRHRRAEERHDRVADVLVHDAVVDLHDPAHPVEIPVEESEDVSRGERLAEAREAPQVHEEDGDLALLAAERARRRA